MRIHDPGLWSCKGPGKKPQRGVMSRKDLTLFDSSVHRENPNGMVGHFLIIPLNGDFRKNELVSDKSVDGCKSEQLNNTSCALGKTPK